MLRQKIKKNKWNTYKTTSTAVAVAENMKYSYSIKKSVSLFFLSLHVFPNFLALFKWWKEETSAQKLAVKGKEKREEC